MKKNNLVFTNLALAVLLVPDGTFSWFTDNSIPVVNELKTGTLLMSINDNFDVYDKNNIKPGEYIEKSVVICNDGSEKMFVRVVIDAKFEDDLPTDGIVSYKLGEGWVKEGKHYYFTTSVGPDSYTPPLLIELSFDDEKMNSDYQGKRFSLIIVSESVQATKKAAETVWGEDIPDIELLAKGNYGPCLPAYQVEKVL